MSVTSVGLLRLPGVFRQRRRLNPKWRWEAIVQRSRLGDAGVMDAGEGLGQSCPHAAARDLPTRAPQPAYFPRTPSSPRPELASRGSLSAGGPNQRTAL